jgi:hypothetical protein
MRTPLVKAPRKTAGPVMVSLFGRLWLTALISRLSMSCVAFPSPVRRMRKMESVAVVILVSIGS